MDNAIPEKNVFPVSSRLAYLANRVIREIEVNHKIPSAQSAEWVADFAKEAFGASFEDSELEEIEEVSRSANKLWKKSRFSTLLENVILAAQKNAAWYAIKSAASKTEHYAEKLENFLNIREISLSISAKTLQNEIESIKVDYEKIISCENDTKEKVKKKIEELNTNIKNSFNQYKKQINQDLNDFFDANSQVSKSNDKSKLQNLINSISETVSLMIDETEKNIKKSIVDAVDLFEDEFANTVKSEAEEIANNLLKRLSKEGFTINLKIPDGDVLKIDADRSNMLNDAIEEKVENFTTRVRVRGLWGWLCEFFNSENYGWEVNHHKKKSYSVNISDIKNSVLNNINDFFTDLENIVTEKIQQPIQENIENFFIEFKNTIQEIGGDLSAGLRNNQKSKADNPLCQNSCQFT